MNKYKQTKLSVVCAHVTGNRPEPPVVWRKR